MAFVSDEHNPLTMSDEQILQQINSAHVHSDTQFLLMSQFDDHSVLAVVDNMLTRSTDIVDRLLQRHFGPNLDRIPQNSTIRIISSLYSQENFIRVARYCQLSCKAPRAEENAHKTTMAILNELSMYDWDAKALITLAALALEYAEFWVPAEPETIEPNTTSRHQHLIDNHHEAVMELNTTIKTLLQVIHLIFDLQKLITSSNIKEFPTLIRAAEQIPVHVYWSIMTIVAIVAQINSLITTGSDLRQQLVLSHFDHKIDIILSQLRKKIALNTQQLAMLKYNFTMRKLFQKPKGVLQVFKFLIFAWDTPQPLFDGTTKTLVNIEVLRSKNVYLFISTLEVTDEEISVILNVYESIKSKDEHKIVWIPMVEEWTEAQKKKMEILKAKMPWYVVQHYEVIAGYKFIKEEWHFKKTPIVVVMNPQGMVQLQHEDTFRLIKVWGMNAIPCDSATEEGIDPESKGFLSIIYNVHPSIATWMKEEKYIFLYGGSDKEWVQKFTMYTRALANNVVLMEDKTPINMFCMETEDKSLVTKFWTRIEIVFISMLYKDTLDEVTHTELEVQKMLSYKNESGWALLIKGLSVILSGHGINMLKTVAEFDKWKEVATHNGFELSFKEYHTTIEQENHICSKIELPNLAGKLPETILINKCPCCPRQGHREVGADENHGLPKVASNKYMIYELNGHVS